jgi:hypothetical protein
MAVTTWSFEDGFQGFTFNDNLSPPGVGSAVRVYDVAEGIENTCTITASPPNNRFASGENISPTLNAVIAPGDTIEFDYGPAVGDLNHTQLQILATYTDTTTEFKNTSIVVGAGTFTITLTQNKTLDFFNCNIVVGANAPSGARTETRSIFEVRLTTAATVDPIAGLLSIPSTFLNDGGFDNIASVSADGLNVYIAAFNNLGAPTLVKIVATATADGSVVFEPGAGGKIGVQCGTLNAEHLWIAGNFGGTDVVEKSEDAGASFDVKDDATIGAVRSFVVGPSDDTRVLIFDESNGDILETIDDGVTWNTINASVSPEINAIARFDNNPQETVSGNQGGATDSINYSVNSGANLEDFQTGVYPNADATKVIAN